MFWLYETKYVLLQLTIWGGSLPSDYIIVTLHSVLLISHWDNSAITSLSLQMGKLRPKSSLPKSHNFKGVVSLGFLALSKVLFSALRLDQKQTKKQVESRKIDLDVFWDTQAKGERWECYIGYLDICCSWYLVGTTVHYFVHKIFKRFSVWSRLLHSLR